MPVLVRLSGDEYPIWPAYYDGDGWRSADGETLEEPVLGWMQLEAAAQTLDGGDAR